MIQRERKKNVAGGVWNKNTILKIYLLEDETTVSILDFSVFFSQLLRVICHPAGVGCPCPSCREPEREPQREPKDDGGDNVN